MSRSIQKGKAVSGFIDSEFSNQLFEINAKPGHFFSLRYRSKTLFPKLTIESGTDVVEQSTCFNNRCQISRVDGERFRGFDLMVRVTPVSGFGNFKLKLIDHGNLNSIAKKVIRNTNKQRRQRGLDPLTGNKRLQMAAQAHVDDMDAVGRYLGHESSDGRQLRDRIDEVNYQWRYIAENAATGQGSPQDVVESWMNSPGHRANIISKDVSEIGVGFAIDNQTGATYWIQNFGKPA